MPFTNKDTSRKRKFDVVYENNQGERQNNNFTICLRYPGMIFMDFLGDNELVVVEQPWIDIVNDLPDALERKRYGT